MIWYFFRWIHQNRVIFEISFFPGQRFTYHSPAWSRGEHWAKCKINLFPLVVKKERLWYFQFTQDWTRGHSTLQKIPPIHRLGLKPSLEQSFLKISWKTLKHWKYQFLWNFPIARFPINGCHSETRHMQTAADHNLFLNLMSSALNPIKPRHNCHEWFGVLVINLSLVWLQLVSLTCCFELCINAVSTQMRKVTDIISRPCWAAGWPPCRTSWSLGFQLRLLTWLSSFSRLASRHTGNIQFIPHFHWSLLKRQIWICPKMELWASESKNGYNYFTPTHPQNYGIDICFMRLPCLDEPILKHCTFWTVFSQFSLSTNPPTKKETSLSKFDNMKSEKNTDDPS